MIRAGADRAEIEGHFRLGARRAVIEPLLPPRDWRATTTS
jgi:hypothetical protein